VNKPATVSVVDADIRHGIRNTTTVRIPQLYTSGRFVGGSDIMMEMYENGEPPANAGRKQTWGRPAQVADQRIVTAAKPHRWQHPALAREACWLGFLRAVKEIGHLLA
jgi:hypothetical protein